MLKYELEIARILKDEFSGRLLGHTSERWCERARTRLELMRNVLWDDTRGMFYDYDVKTNKLSSYASTTALYPLWATGDNACGIRLFDDYDRIDKLVRTALE